MICVFMAANYLGSAFMHSYIGQLCWWIGPVGVAWVILEVVYAVSIYPRRLRKFERLFLCDGCGATAMISPSVVPAHSA